MQENYNINVERTILATFLDSRNQFLAHHKALHKESFFHPFHKSLYESMISLHQDNQPIEHHFIEKDLKAKEKFDENFMMEVMSSMPLSNVKSYIPDLQKHHIKRAHLEITDTFRKGKITATQLTSQIQKIETLYQEDSKHHREKIKLKHLTPFFKDILAELKAVNNYPDSMALATILTSMGGLVGARAKMSNQDQVVTYPIIWSMVIAPSGTGKSVLYRTARELVFGDIQNEFYDEYEKERASYKLQHKSYMSLGKQERQETEEPEEPMLKLTIFQNDGTPEAKIKSLQNNQNGGVIFYDEMKAELEKANGDPSYKALKTSLFDGDKYHKELVKGGTYILRHPALSEVGLIQEPWLLEATNKNDMASGFFARYLFSYNNIYDFKAPQINKEKKYFNPKFAEAGKKLLDMLEFDRKEAFQFQFDSEAQQAYEEWFNAYSQNAFYTEATEEQAISMRLSTYVLKFALISYLFNNAYTSNHDMVVSGLDIGIEYFNEAIEIMELFRSESDKVLQLFQKTKKLHSKLEGKSEKLLKSIEHSADKQISRSKALQNIRGLKKTDIDQYVELGIIKVVKIESKEYLLKA